MGYTKSNFTGSVHTTDAGWDFAIEADNDEDIWLKIHISKGVTDESLSQFQYILAHLEDFIKGISDPEAPGVKIG